MLRRRVVRDALSAFAFPADLSAEIILISPGTFKALLENVAGS
jgi:hypothetical protein